MTGEKHKPDGPVDSACNGPWLFHRLKYNLKYTGVQIQ